MLIRMCLAALAIASFAALALPAVAQDSRIGAYAGKWDGKLDSSLIIKAIDADGTVHGTYSWGDFPAWGVKKGSVDFNKPKLDRNTFSFGDSKQTQTFTFAGEKINGVRTMSDGKSGGSITYTKIAQTMSK